MDKLKESMKTIQDKLNLMDETFLHYKNDLDKIVTDLKNDLKSELETFMTQVKVLCDQMINLNNRIDKLERENKKCHMIVSGVPELNDVSDRALINKICAAIGYEQNDGTFTNIFRLKRTGERKSTSIIAVFSSVVNKSGFFIRYKALGNLNLSHIGLQLPSRIYCNDGLTAKNAALYYKSRQLLRAGIISRTFTKRGLVYIVTPETNNIVLIRDFIDLNVRGPTTNNNGDVVKVTNHETDEGVNILGNEFNTPAGVLSNPIDDELPRINMNFDKLAACSSASVTTRGRTKQKQQS